METTYWLNWQMLGLPESCINTTRCHETLCWMTCDMSQFTVVAGKRLQQRTCFHVVQVGNPVKQTYRNLNCQIVNHVAFYPIPW